MRSTRRGFAKMNYAEAAGRCNSAARRWCRWLAAGLLMATAGNAQVNGVGQIPPGHKHSCQLPK